MATESKLYSGFAAPSMAYIADNPDPAKAIYQRSSMVWGVDVSGQFYFAWKAADRTYQIRWRSRLRKKPTTDAAGGWAGWSSWQGANTCGRKTNRDVMVPPTNTQNPNTWFMANARPDASTNLYAANQEWYIHYVPIVLTNRSSTCDAEQYQVQIRTWGEGNQMHGNHKGETFTIYYRPGSFAVTGVKLNDADGIRVYYTTDWGRDGNTVEITWQDGTTVEIANVKGGVNGTQYFTVPSSKLDQNYDVGEMCHPKSVRFVTCDTDVRATRTATVPANGWEVQPLYTNPLPNPSISVTTDDGTHTATVTLRQSGSSYSWKTVTVWAGWTAPDGKWITCSPSKVVSETNYDVAGNYTRTGVYEFSNVPSDIAVSYRAKVQTVADNDENTDGTTVKVARATSDSWGTDSYGHSGTIMKSGGRAYLSIGDAVAALVCSLEEAGVTWNRAYSPNVELETCAGRQREVSRHGTGGAATVQVKGDIVYDTAAHDMGEGRRLADWEAMKRKTGADGYIVLPQGIWAKVAVKGIDIDTAWPAHSVTLDLEEVS